MKSNLGEFEEIVLFIVAAQHNEAYGMSITKTIEDDLDRSVTLSSVHTVLYRLEEKGYVKSFVGGSSEIRGGRRKRLFSITDAGKEVLKKSMELRQKLWASVSSIIFEKSQ